MGMRVGTMLQAWWARASLRLFGVEVVVDGELPSGPHLVCANHRGYIDILVLASYLPGRFVAMRELAGWPLIGWMCWSSGTLFLDRASKRNLLEVGPRIRETLAAGSSVILFPEGGAGSGDRLRPLRSPLFEAAVREGMPVLPIALSYETPGIPWSTAWTVSWWGGMGLPRHLFRCLKLPRIRARLAIAGEPRLGTDRKRLTEAIAADLEGSLRPVDLYPEPPDNPWAGQAADAGVGKSG